ncbi:MAG: redox-regulated ATPase YchF [Candidatus Dojkabacteria bacterium]
MAAVRSHSLSIGIVGLPNSGKSTFFNSLTKSEVLAANYPFATIDKNVGVVQVPDTRLDKMEQFFKAAKKVPSAIKFVDIAGLVKGASKGEGLGNQFLSHIREVDAIIYVLRAFSSATITHVYDRVDPADDLEIVQSELILKDFETVEKRLADATKRARPGNDKQVEIEVALLKRLHDWLGQGKSAIEMSYSAEEQPIMDELWLLTNKRRIYCLNVRQGTDAAARNEWKAALEKYIGAEESKYITEVDVKALSEMIEMSSEELNEYLELLGDEKPTTLDEIIKLAFDRLNLLTFYTGSEKEVNAWSIERGATAREAAGVIHTDLMKGFITADVVNVEALIEAGGMVGAKEKGLVRNQGKEYLVQDGDYMIVHSN